MKIMVTESGRDAVSKPEKKGKKNIQGVIEYTEPPDLQSVFATSARILVMSPMHASLNFYTDKMIDDVLEEQIIEDKGETSRVVSKRAYDGPKQISREMVCSVSMPLPSLLNFARNLRNVSMDVERDLKKFGKQIGERERAQKTKG